MPSLQQRKRPCLVVGFVIVIVLGLFWYAEIPFLGKTFAGGEESPTVIRKRLPSTPTPAPTSETAPIAPAPAPPTVGQEKPPAPQPATETPTLPPSTVGQEKPLGPQAPQMVPPVSAPMTAGPEKPQEPQAPVTPPPVAAAPPAPEVSKEMSEKTVEAKPAATPPPTTPAARVSAKKSEPAKPIAKPVKAVAKTHKPEPGAYYPLSLLLCSHRVKEYAFASILDCRRKGLEAYLVYTDLGEKGMWWRTLCGQYRNFEETIQVRKDLSLEHIVAVKTPFANLLGEYPSKKEAAEAGVQFAKKKEIFLYVAKGTGDAARLLVGAFPTQVQAERQQRELEAMGISARVIRR